MVLSKRGELHLKLEEAMSNDFIVGFLNLEILVVKT